MRGKVEHEDLNDYPDFICPDEYLSKFPVRLEDGNERITFNHNMNLPVHRWSFYVQGFSAAFVDCELDRHKIAPGNLVLDPFTGSGTVNACAKMRGIESIGVELHPLLCFTAKTKTSWELDTQELLTAISRFDYDIVPTVQPPDFILSHKHFNEQVLESLVVLKENILRAEVREPIHNLIWLAFSSILIQCSRLTRGPGLGYYSRKEPILPQTPYRLFEAKIAHIAADLGRPYIEGNNTPAVIVRADAKEFAYQRDTVDLAITSPPYVNGMDYVIAYKIETAWLDIARSQKELRDLKAIMVACDNVPKMVTRTFAARSNKYSDEWLDEIVTTLEKRIENRPSYRRPDIAKIVHKYFDDLACVFENVSVALRPGAPFVLVIGDSLMADVYIPTDLLLGRMGTRFGLTIESLRKARNRRSGQRRNFKLRETVLTLRK